VKPVRIPVLFLVRLAFLASVAVVASIWGVVSYYTHPHLPMMVPVPAEAGVWDAGPGLFPAPDLEIVPR
jgi:hypothetical protein